MSITNHQPFRVPPDMPAREELDDVLGRHFSRELAPQQGRALARFEQATRDADRRRAREWVIVGSVAALAASIALIVLVGSMNFDADRPDSAVTPVVAETDAVPMELERSVTWQTFDEGTILLEDSTPMRKLRREVLERVQYYDPGRQKLVEMTIPKEEIFLIGFNTY